MHPPECAEAVVRRLRLLPAATRPGPLLVGIDGRSGSGKTAVARAVAQLLANVQVVHMDDLYPGWHGLAAGVAALPRTVLVPLREAGAVSFDAFDWHTGRSGASRRVGPCAAVIVEGCGSTCGDAAAMLDLRVWLDSPAAVRRDRAIARDGSTLADRWSLWRAQEDALFGPQRPWDRADLVLHTD